MTVYLNPKDLINGLRVHEKSLKSTVLKSVVLRTTATSLQTESNTGALTLHTRVICDVRDDFAVVVPVKALVSVLRRLSKHDEIGVGYTEGPNLMIRAGSREFAILIEEDKPVDLVECFVRPQTQMSPVRLNAGILRDLVVRCLKVVSTDEMRPALTQAAISLIPKGKKATFVSTDGHRMLIDPASDDLFLDETKAVPWTEEIGFTAAISSSALNVLPSLLPKEDGEVVMAFQNPEGGMFNRGDELGSITSELYDMYWHCNPESYPDWTMVSDGPGRSANAEIVVNMARMVETLHMAHPMTPGNDMVSIGAIEGQSLIFTKNASGHFKDLVSEDVKLPENGRLLVCFNRKYMEEGLAMFPTETFKISARTDPGVGDNTNPFILEFEGYDSKYVMMPCRYGFEYSEFMPAVEPAKLEG